MITAKVIEDSVSKAGKRLTTLQLCYHRFIHSEFMTHRQLSRCASSSRAIPIDTMIDQVLKNPAMPLYWGSNKPGMQAGDEVANTEMAKMIWKASARVACDQAKHLQEQGLHKQIVNRVLEPYQWIHVVVSATEWDNFFELRIHPAAQPEMRALAEAMKAAMDASTPERRDWHLPYVTTYEREGLDFITCCKISAARCARVSYIRHGADGPNIHEDIKLYERLAGMEPKHASPLEHPARELGDALARSGNFEGWQQFRHMLNEGQL